jgi:hypothetical protein
MTHIGLFQNRAVRSFPSVLALSLIGLIPIEASAQGWSAYGRDSQHSNLGAAGSVLPQVVKWKTPVDLQPQYASGGDLLIHYGSTMITRLNTVLMPVKTGTTDGFRIEAHRGSDGTLLWSLDSDYTLPGHNWTPPFGCTLTPKDRAVVMPGAGGTVIVRGFPDTPTSTSQARLAFYGLGNYNVNKAAFNSAIWISTPITCDALGNFYFGYVSSGVALPGYPNGIPSGLARVDPTGFGTFVSAPALSGDNGMVKVVYNCAPALSNDGNTVYVAVNNASFGQGYICSATSATLTPIASKFLLDPRTDRNVSALLPDDGTASPTVGPDGDVYFGVLEGNFPSHNDRGWMLHFDSGLTKNKIPGSFGWDDTASIVPSSLVPSYSGPSSYLILTKYNNYAGIGTGDGNNKVAVLDPNVSMPDPVSGNSALVMQEVLTVVGPTPVTGQEGVHEWCINAAAIDPVNKCAIVNSEDGHVYRWSFLNNSLTPAFPMAAATGEAYTSTVIGPDGSVYATNNATLYCCVSNPPHSIPPGKPSHRPLLGGEKPKARP